MSSVVKCAAGHRRDDEELAQALAAIRPDGRRLHTRRRFQRRRLVGARDLDKKRGVASWPNGRLSPG